MNKDRATKLKNAVSRAPLQLLDFRRSAPATDIVEMALAHVTGDKVEASYRHGELFEERRNWRMCQVLHQLAGKPNDLR